MGQRTRNDWLLLAVTGAMVAFGLVMMFSASSVLSQEKYKSSWFLLSRQLIWAVIAAAVLIYLKLKDYRLMKSAAWAFVPLGVTLILLVVVWFADPRTHRWLRLGPISLQPSELAKPALILFLAYCLTLRQRSVNDFRVLAQTTLVLALVAGMVVLADLGTAVVLVVTAVVMFYVAGIKKRYFAAALAIGMLFGTVAIYQKPYRIARIFGFFDPNYTLLETRLVKWLDPDGKFKERIEASAAARDPDYHVRQSKIAVGSGGLAGRGPMNSRQKLYYLPEPHTDFIYAVVAEELGFLGAALVLLGFLTILWRGLRLSWGVNDDFGRYVAVGATTAIVFQALVNMSVVLDLVPTKGIPLPMISQGGSSLLSTLSSLGLLLSVSEHSA